MSTNELVESAKRLNRILLCVATVASLGAGCATDANSDQTTGDTDTLGLQAPSSQPTTLRDPAGVYFAEVVANGTGCPAGSWNTELSSDGQTFTTTFSKYEASVDETTSVSIKDCQLAIKLHSPQGLSYSVESFYYSGYSYLEQGVTGRQIANYYFQGNPVNADEARTDLVGNYDDTYLFTDKVELADTVWSPCGLDRDLNITTRIRLQNSSPKRNGYMNLTAVDGSAKLELKLAWRTCNAGTTTTTPTQDAGTAVDAGTSSGRRTRR